MSSDRDTGTANAVIALHATASSGGQWRRLITHLSPRWRVLTPDLVGYSKDAGESTYPGFRLEDEVEQLAPVFAQAGERFHLIGHSYGALIALLAATRLGSRVVSLVIYEPAAWSIAAHADPQHPSALEVANLRRRFDNLVGAGRLAEVARKFIDYWSGPGAFAAFTPERQQVAARTMLKVRVEFQAEADAHATGETTKESFAAIRAPILYLTGSETKGPIRRLTEVLAPALPTARHIDLPGLGHMGPITHPEVVNGEIERLLGQAESEQGRQAASTIGT